ncbi:hypothetical protein ABH991_003752 [Bradyrhizobium ottawaense]|uniref:Uncharacterized protein n=1 Tax=Bradyrhizobium ottawaense TaxID=931866 RepID=A0ABV4G6G5_9BRAD
MFKGFTVAVVALISTAQLDRYLTNGIRHAFGF